MAYCLGCRRSNLSPSVQCEGVNSAYDPTPNLRRLTRKVAQLQAAARIFKYLKDTVKYDGRLHHADVTLQQSLTPIPGHSSALPVPK
jgi:hypothetical protein